MIRKITTGKEQTLNTANQDLQVPRAHRAAAVNTIPTALNPVITILVAAIIITTILIQEVATVMAIAATTIIILQAIQLHLIITQLLQIQTDLDPDTKQ